MWAISDRNRDPSRGDADKHSEQVLTSVHFVSCGKAATQFGHWPDTVEKIIGPLCEPYRVDGFSNFYRIPIRDVREAYVAKHRGEVSKERGLRAVQPRGSRPYKGTVPTAG